MEAFLDRYILSRGIPADMTECSELAYMLDWGSPESSSIDWCKSNFSRIIPGVCDALLEEKCGLVLFPESWKLTDLKYFSDIEDKHPCPEMPWKYVRGVSWMNVIALGEEFIYEYCEFHFDALMHEFAHQIHRNVMHGSDETDLDRLYMRAKLDGNCLDAYAELTVGEYFAQGFSAMFSAVKSEYWANHPASELCLKDHGLYNFCRRYLI